MESNLFRHYNDTYQGGMLYEIPQILGVGCRDLHDYDILHWLQTQIREGGTEITLIPPKTMSNHLEKFTFFT